MPNYKFFELNENEKTPVKFKEFNFNSKSKKKSRGEEAETFKFRALEMPDFNEVRIRQTLVTKPHKDLTIAQPFNLNTEQRGATK